MKIRISVLLASILLLSLSGFAGGELKTPHEIKGENYSATYAETISFYKELEAASPFVKVKTYKDGTDIGRPLHLIVITKNKTFHPVPLRAGDKRFVMILNGIHPGEPCGVDASMALARNLVSNSAYSTLLEHLVICIVPIYNVGGALNRGSTSRANQNGPEAYGFRGNSRNLDLNRDFIKADSRNAQTFIKLFTEWRPDIFIDTHTSNGADYQYTMTYIPTQKDKFQPDLAKYMNTVLNPELTKQMAASPYEMCPYAQTVSWGATPDEGIVGFLETPRYATGYAALFNTIGYTTESHMLKPFQDRLSGTYSFMLNLLKLVNRDRIIIGRMRRAADVATRKQEEFAIHWTLDRSQSTPITFKGYAATRSPSAVTGKPRLSYDRSSPWTKEIPWFNTYQADKTITKPIAYIIPQAWREVIDRLQWNGIKMHRLSKDIDLEVKVTFLESFKPSPRPYEGHYPLAEMKFRQENQKLHYLVGDYVIYTDQVSNRYIIETLEPEAHDSFLHWNFFDEILMRKEYFSPYVFEKTAQQLLDITPALKQELAEKVKADSTFAASDWAQMDFVYQHSQHFEPSYLRYPVTRMEIK
ncbi:MAG TPA: hypothetical protein ENJ82_02905, partial [Bacteroidetes bacterium]|nr:hypothetical protein [Bacteroidota bacterium]